MNSVLFYKKDGKCYFRFMGKEYQISSRNLLFLKSRIDYPNNFVFCDISLEKAKSILNYFNQWNVNIKFIDLRSEKDKKKRIANLDVFYDKLLVPTYRISNRDMLYNTCANPYELHDGEVSYLMEYDKEFLKDSDVSFVNYYFIAEELSNIERNMLSDNYTVLEFNYVYRYHSIMNNCKKLIKK